MEIDEVRTKSCEKQVQNDKMTVLFQNSSIKEI